MRVPLIVLAGLALAGCYETPHPSCAFLCGTDNACPSTYYCAADGWCKADGVPESFVCDPTAADAGTDAADIDTPTDADIDAEIDAPIDAEIDGPVDAEVDAPPIDASPPMLTILTTNPIAFGSVIETQEAIQTVVVRNGGGSPTSILMTSVAGSSAFSRVMAASDTCTGGSLQPSTNCQFEVRFSPSQTGPLTAVAMVSATAGGSASINLTGTGLAMLTASPSPVALGSVMVGMNASQVVTVTNAGTLTSGPITITPPTGAFSITAETCTAAPLPAADTCTITVQFAPTATGAQSSMFTLDANLGGPRTVSVTGTGQ